jgi:hypothetical protein
MNMAVTNYKFLLHVGVHLCHITFFVMVSQQSMVK